MIHEKIKAIQSNIEMLLTTNEVQFKSVRVAHYREASYFAFDGSYVYVIVDCPFSGSPTICYVGETTNLGPILRTHARNHRFSHAFVVDMGEMEKSMRVFVKDLLIDRLNPTFQSSYCRCEIYRTNNFKREFATNEVAQWSEWRKAKTH